MPAMRASSTGHSGQVRGTVPWTRRIVPWNSLWYRLCKGWTSTGSMPSGILGGGAQLQGGRMAIAKLPQADCGQVRWNKKKLVFVSQVAYGSSQDDEQQQQ